MAEFLGMNTQQVREFAGQLDQRAGQIDELRQSLTGKLQSTAWTGTDANQFRQEWNDTHAASLTRVADALRDAANKARRNADAQEQTSANA